ncbi:hypothetical protein AVEN_213803-1, partial [Araneus ventricosus]
DAATPQTRRFFAETGLEHGTLASRNRNLTTKPPRNFVILHPTLQAFLQPNANMGNGKVYTNSTTHTHLKPWWPGSRDSISEFRILFHRKSALYMNLFYVKFDVTDHIPTRWCGAEAQRVQY